MGKYTDLLEPRQAGARISVSSPPAEQLSFAGISEITPQDHPAEQRSAPFELNAQLICNPEDLLAWVKHEACASPDSPLVIDIETSGLSFSRDQICGIALLGDGAPVYVSIGHESGTRINPLAAAEILNPLLSGGRTKVLHNATFDLPFLARAGFTIAGPIVDTRLMAREIHHRATISYALKSLACDYIHPNADHWDRVLEEMLKQRFRSGSKENLWRLSAEEVYQYACADVVLTRKLYAIFYQLLDRGLEQNKRPLAYLENESELIEAVVEMEVSGFRVDHQGLADHLKTFESRLTQVDRELDQLLGCGNISYTSTKQVLPVLESAGIRPINPKTGKPSICVDALESCSPKPPVIEVLIQRKRIENQQKQLASIPESVSDGRIRTQLTISAQPGERFSSTGPSLYTGKKNPDPGEVTLRNFILPDNDCSLIFCDFAASHFRILSHLCQDKNMGNVFHAGKDFHRATAALLFGRPYEAITPDERDKAKPLGFSVIYGMGEAGLAEKLKMDRSSARRMKNDFLYRIYPKLGPYLNQVQRQVVTHGYVESGIYGVKISVNRDAAYNGLNYQIQATESEMMKNTLIRLSKFLRNYRSRLALPFHDEVILQIHETEMDLIPKVQAIVEDHKLRVPMVSEVKIARTCWAEKEAFILRDEGGTER